MSMTGWAGTRQGYPMPSGGQRVRAARSAPRSPAAAGTGADEAGSAVVGPAGRSFPDLLRLSQQRYGSRRLRQLGAGTLLGGLVAVVWAPLLIAVPPGWRLLSDVVLTGYFAGVAGNGALLCWLVDDAWPSDPPQRAPRSLAPHLLALLLVPAAALISTARQRGLRAPR